MTTAETPPSNVTQLPTTQPQQPPSREVRVVSDPIAVLDTSRFEHMQRIATVMATSNLIPESLCMEGKGDEKTLLPFNTVMANCFLVTNQAVRWEMDPFAVAQCVSVVHGKLCYEGKLIAAVMQAKLGIDLEYEISGQNDAMKVVVSAAIGGKPVVDSKGQPKTIEGTVSEWKTTHSGSPWSARGGSVRMLRYRGAREWARVHAPGLMLGVYSDDEMEDLNDNMRASQARELNPPKKPPAPTDDPSVTEAKQGVVAEQKTDPQAETKKGPPPPAEVTVPTKEQPKQNTQDPESFRKWADSIMGTCSTGEALEETFNSQIAPRLENLFPPDQDDVMSLYRKHERRLEP